MSVLVRIPTPLRPMANGQKEVHLKGVSVREILENLVRDYPGIRERLMDEKGEVRRFINIYVNEEDIRFLGGTETPLKDGDELSIIPAIAGGCR
ncbi:ubiquitin-like small modifier protein 1 [Leptospirillum ferriphilum]|uniref:MoaD/ThiS family protein n=2 Tax=Leptospirillum TaxID=179 RepID=A0A094WFP7_9BACT|nr:ubiquitin-like small modifier protein 1 [Leptospirillum ferriphilum]EDZ38579.1 MAG: Putative ThiS family protein [Leptospirillum sp. Group II '5-way CG']KGA94467.1 MoaD/ThiS family protein [Leptospirillum ferriphilum]MCL5259887.1 MoaD/ThiS family protein [Nitrospirota bacterium]